MNHRVSRREFIQVASAASLAGATVGPAALRAAVLETSPRKPYRGSVCLFSKSVPQLSWSELAKAAKEAGFDGIDLTVREDGHVFPKRAAADLPKAIAAIRAEGMEVPMLTTELQSVESTGAHEIFEIAGMLSVPFIKPGYYAYHSTNPLDDVREAGVKFRGLVDLAKENGVQIGYHNHPNLIGGSVWDIANVIGPLDPRWSGYYFDLGHSSVSEGEDEWRVAARLVLPRLKMLAVKDMTWLPGGARGWRADACPMGKGMTPWKEFLDMLAQSDFHGPISLAQAYAIPGATDDGGVALARTGVSLVMAAAKSNLAFFRSQLREAFERA